MSTPCTIPPSAPAVMGTDTGLPTRKGPLTCTDGAAVSSANTPAKSTSSRGKGAESAWLGMGPGVVGEEEEEEGEEEDGGAMYKGVGRPL
jgi:hypothetical protein